MSAEVFAEIVGRRIEIVRQAKNFETQTEFADRLGVSKSRLNNWMAGGILLPVDFAIQIKKLTGIPLDYIYCGELSGVPADLSLTISKLEKSVSR